MHRTSIIFFLKKCDQSSLKPHSLGQVNTRRRFCLLIESKCAFYEDQISLAIYLQNVDKTNYFLFWFILFVYYLNIYTDRRVKYRSKETTLRFTRTQKSIYRLEWRWAREWSHLEESGTPRRVLRSTTPTAWCLVYCEKSPLCAVVRNT